MAWERVAWERVGAGGSGWERRGAPGGLTTAWTTETYLVALFEHGLEPVRHPSTHRSHVRRQYAGARLSLHLNGDDVRMSCFDLNG